MYVCMCVCVYVCIYVCACVCVCMYVRMYVPVIKLKFNKKSDFINFSLNNGSVKPIENCN